MDGDEVYEGKRTLRRSLQMRDVYNAVNGDAQAFQFRNHRGSLPYPSQKVHLKIRVYFCARRMFSLFIRGRFLMFVP